MMMNPPKTLSEKAVPAHYDAAAKDIKTQKDGFLDKVEERLEQEVSDDELFTVRFEIV